MNLKNLIAQTGGATVNLREQAISQGVSGITQSAKIDFSHLFGRLMSFVMAIAAILLLLFLIWGAIDWITSSGDKGKVENARNRITQAIIGLIVLSASIAVFKLVQTFLGIEVLTFL